MSETLASPKFDAAGFEAFLATRDEPGWLVDQRRAAWRQFESMDWPSPKAEEWIRSNLRMFRLDQYHAPIEEPADVTAPSLLVEGVDLAGHLETVDSRVRSESLADAWHERGVVFGSLARLAHEHPELVRQHLMTRAFDVRYDRFAALHAAFWSGGHLLYVPRGVVVDQPLHVNAILSNGGTDTGHTLIVLDEGAEATFLYESNSPERKAGGLHCGAVEIIQRPGSHMRYVNLQDWGYKAWHFAHQKAVVDRDASLQYTIAAVGGAVAQVNQHVELVGPGANCQVNGVMFTEGRQHLTYNTLQHHAAPQCRSDFLYKAALQDKSRTVWRGMIQVDPDAQQTDGYQRNDNLLLSHNARADSIPGLEIEADDVRCTHGSTTSQVDEELIFYARCRGYTRNEAIRMIVTGFFQQIFDRITIPGVRDALGGAIARKVREYD